MSKLCPKCVNMPLKIADRKGVEIDYCPTCNGIWLDRGELNKIIDQYVSKGSSSNPAKTKIVKSYSHSKVKTATSVADTVFDIFDFFSGE